MDYYRVILPPSALRGMQRSFSSSAFLFPSTKVWGASEVLAMTGEKNYTLSNLEEFFGDIGYTLGYQQYLTINPALVAEAPGVEVSASARPPNEPKSDFRFIVYTERGYKLPSCSPGPRATSRSTSRRLSTATETALSTFARWRCARTGTVGATPAKT